MARFNGDSNNNTLNGTAENDELYGYEKDDILFGGDGSDTDTLVGGLGNDTLIGSIGKDFFVFNDSNIIIEKDASNNYHISSSEGHDIITNFSEAEGDAIYKLDPQASTSVLPIKMPPVYVQINLVKINLGVNTSQYTLSSSFLTLESNSLQNPLYNNQSNLGTDTSGFGL
jgi:hypothetical protein